MKNVWIMITAIGTAVTMSLVAEVCRYKQSGGHAQCNNGNDCSTYVTPTAIYCFDSGVETGATVGNTVTNRVTQTTYSGGGCSSGICMGGVAGQQEEVEQVSTYCKPCSGK